MESVRAELISKIKTAASANVKSSKPELAHEEVSSGTVFNGDHIIALAASTGGPPAVTKVLTALPADSPPILITQHMPKGVTKLFAEGLNERCKFTVKEAQEGDRVQERLALIAPGGFHMMVTKEHKIHLTTDPPVNYVRPAADVMMFSMAEIYGAKNVGVILTGMGSDGAKGIKAIKGQGGFNIAQDQATSVVYGMPFVAYQTGCVDKVVALDKIPRAIIKACT
jgi:two-component system chemotaxis response regulator CheB